MRTGRARAIAKDLAIAAALIAIGALAGMLVAPAETARTAAPAVGENPATAPTTPPTVPPTTPATPPSTTTTSATAVTATTATTAAVAEIAPTSDPLPQTEELNALELLASIPVQREHRGEGYSRDLFAIWIDEDGDGCDTRSEVLIHESLTPLADTMGCSTFGGSWLSRYDAARVVDPSELDIDHLVALKEAWDSGAWAWPPVRRIAYGNDLTDPRTLVAVTASSNRSKGDRDPSNWIPDGDVCQFAADWIAVKARWSLSMDESEHGRLRNLLGRQCPDMRVAPLPAIP